MANEWLKIRINLPSNPKVVAMAELLGRKRGGLASLTTGFGGPFLEVVTMQVACSVVVCGLIRVWGTANEVGSDGVLKGVSLEGVDAIALIRGFGAAMAEVGWARESTDPKGIVLPNFAEFNSPVDSRGADRQRRYRERHATVTRNVTRDVTRNDREEKRREEVTTKASAHENKREPDPVRNALAEVNGETTLGGDTDDDPQFETFWQHYPPVNKHGRAEAERAWFRLTPAERAKAAATVAAYAKAKATGPPDHRRRVLKPANWLESRVFEQDPATWLPPQETSKVSAQFARSDDAYFSQS